MEPPTTTKPWVCNLTPCEVIARWPADLPLVALISVAGPSPWSRWSVLASPEATLTIGHDQSHWSPAPPARHEHTELSGDPVSDLRTALNFPSPVPECTPLHPPFRKGWIGWLSYELGHVLEPASCTSHVKPNDRMWPLAQLAWCERLLVHDAFENRWYAVNGPPPTLDAIRHSHCEFSLGPIEANLTSNAAIERIQRVINYIAAGDIFQANFTQRFSAPFEGGTRQFAAASISRASSWYGGYFEDNSLEEDARAIVSLSPELFIQHDPVTRELITRPIKGTRPTSTNPAELLRSEKDAAELHMIVDLMRNDLGRVSELGSVHVPIARAIESHAGVHHGVGEVRSTRRTDATTFDILKATFPPGSVTGAPKIRAMQIINELEATRRGPYCGAFGWFGCDGRLDLNVAIRTASISGTRASGSVNCISGTCDYGAGGGIVADSDPVAELAECFDKTAPIRGLGHQATLIES